ncbi:MAG: cytochrome c oxidase subunit II [Actinomycetota bacterium]|nr:cytochrome c oxidase subunit II [Actinomycetota bacterium]
MRAGSANRRRFVGLTGIAVACVVLLSGCSGALSRGLLPKGVTENSKRVTDLWNGSWLAALGVGVLVWGLTIWCVVAYRRRKDDPEFPEQLRYNVPIEILYTVVPLFMIGVLFYFTARDEEALLSTSAKPDLVVNVVGKQWSWDFNYATQQVYEAGTQAELTGKPLTEDELPTLYLPVDKRVEFVLTARDVIHSFWVPAFLQKLDMIPGRVNKFQVVPTTEGTFAGKCAELCGAYHSAMLFQVKVVSQSDFDAHIKALQDAGQTGQLPNDLNRSQLEPGQGDLVTGAGSGS